LTEDGGDEAAELQRIDRVLRHASARSPLYQWMRKRHAKLADRLDGARPHWAALAAEFGAMGLTDRTGKAPTGERARKTWWRVKADLAARAARRQGPAAVQLLPPPPAQAARTTVPVGGFPPVAPDDEEPAVEAAGDGHEAMFVAMDPGNRSLTGFLDGVLQPATNDAAANAKWLEQLIEHAMDTQASALIDLGGGDTSLGRLLAQLPDLVERLEEAGMAPVALYTLGPRQNDLTALAGMEAMGFQPRATAIVCNEGLADPTTPRAETFARILRHSAYRAAVARGALPLWMPLLDPAVAADIEAKRLHFADARDGIVPEGRKVTPLGSRIRHWLPAMEAEFGAIRSWMP
jgi:hypothetical protein